MKADKAILVGEDRVEYDDSGLSARLQTVIISPAPTKII